MKRLIPPECVNARELARSVGGNETLNDCDNILIFNDLSIYSGMTLVNQTQIPADFTYLIGRRTK